MTRARTMALACLATLLAGCREDGGDEVPFLEACESPSDCPGGWTCPLEGDLNTGEIVDVCTPACAGDALCREILGRDDVFCFAGGFCAIGCGSHSDCPVELPFCRGSDPSCTGYDPWCSTEDYICP